MTKRFLPGKLLPVWIAVSAVLIVAGVVLFSIFGFHYASPEKKTIEIGYDAVVYIENKEDALAEKCEASFSQNGVSFTDKRTERELDVSYVSETGNYLLVYTFSSATDDAKLQTAASKLAETLQADPEFGTAVSVTAHVMEGEHFYEASWRAAVALAVAAIVALVYVGFRFGWANAIAGLVACVNDTLLTLSVFALARIPVYAYGPVLFAGIAAVFSVLLWFVQCMRMRENFKDPAYTSLTAQEAVGLSGAGSWKLVLCFLVPLAAVFAVLGLVASGGLRLFLLPVLVPLAVSVYSSFLLAPAVLVPLKSKFDKMRSSRKKYVGKKKATEAQE